MLYILYSHEVYTIKFFLSLKEIKFREVSYFAIIDEFHVLFIYFHILYIYICMYVYPSYSRRI